MCYSFNIIGLLPFLSILLTFFILYAETHYRIANLPSRYYKKEPELVADMPHRLQPDSMLPVLLILKDADKFPVQLLKLTVAGTRENKTKTLFTYHFNNTFIKSRFWQHVYFCSPPKDWTGNAVVNVIIDYACDHKTKRCFNDNYVLSSHKPFSVYFDDQRLPCVPEWYFGDLHVHTNYTNDQVEFGAPLASTAEMAQAMGIHFFAATDHSYDLDDQPDNYLKNDPTLRKWKNFWNEVDRHNKKNNIVIIPGEEVSAGNTANRNVHLLLLNSKIFYHGDGDSAEKWLQNRPNHSVQNILKHLDAEAVAVASHPTDPPPLLQWLLVRRGVWQSSDFALPNLTGVQMWNGNKKHFFKHGLPRWIKLLLAGHRLCLLAGNDAHGNFNRFRQINVPHLFMKEQQDQVFGMARTGLLIQGKPCLENILSALQSHRAIVTDGPFISMEVHHQSEKYIIGDVCPYNLGELVVRVGSTPAVGKINKVKLCIGDCSIKKETQRNVNHSLGSFKIDISEFISGLPAHGYVRLQAVTEKEGKEFHAFTNPIYLLH